ncbi:MAG TPA: hypothetical protein VGL44_15370 [Gaiellales bacterium]|jgi:hypothetical protein
MGKAKKELTNQRRAARLGTGEGIARSNQKRKGGGVPPWAWLVGGSVLLAAVIVAAAIIVTRSNSSAATNGQASSVVQGRLTHAKIDFTSQGTWPINYTNLDGALTALNLAPNPNATALAVHYHWHLDLYGGGKKIVIPRNIGLQNPPLLSSDVHTHDVQVDVHSGIIHVESTKPGFRATILDLFDVWGVFANNQCIGGYCGGVKVYVDGQIAPSGLQTEPGEHAAVTVVAGSLPAGVTPAKKYTGFTAGE